VLYGNVVLKEYHIIERDGDFFVLRVADMAASPITPALAEVLSRWVPSPGRLVPVRLMQALRSARMVIEDTSQNSLDTPERAVASGSNVKANRPAVGTVTSIALFLAQTCNLACTYCYGQAGTFSGSGLMSAETARKAVDWLVENSHDAKNVHVTFFGGEPLLNLRVLRETVEYAKAKAAQCGKRVRFSITTNATLLDDEIVAYLAQEQIEPLISCDGSAEIHDHQRPFRNGRGSHAAVTAGVQKLLAAFPKVSARATLYGTTDPFSVRRELEEMGFAHCTLTLASPVLLEGSQADTESSVREEATERLLAYGRQEIKELFSAIVNRSLDSELPSEGLGQLSGLATGEKRHAGCGVGRGMRSISVDGTFYPCHRFVGLEEFRMGTLVDYRAAGLNDYHRAAVGSLPVCRSCWARYFCGGGCFYENRSRTGDMRRPDPLFCREMRILQEDLIAGWCRLSEADRAYAREQIARTKPYHEGVATRLSAEEHNSAVIPGIRERGR